MHLKWPPWPQLLQYHERPRTRSWQTAQRNRSAGGGGALLVRPRRDPTELTGWMPPAAPASCVVLLALLPPRYQQPLPPREGDAACSVERLAPLMRIGD